MANDRVWSHAFPRLRLVRRAVWGCPTVQRKRFRYRLVASSRFLVRTGHIWPTPPWGWPQPLCTGICSTAAATNRPQ